MMSLDASSQTPWLQCSRDLPPGIYVIINRVLSSNDETLAITFNGPGQPATATVMTDHPSPAQRVYVRYNTRASYT